MAGRNHVDVNERRLRPIYDYLDCSNNKKALSEAEKVLKKQKNCQCAKVLKALALLRLGRHDAGVTLLEEVHDQHPTDDNTLQAMGICYRETNRMELIAEMYNNAHKAKPDNEEILSALFMSYVRLADYSNQQKSAMALHRLRPAKNPYYFWAVMSIVMQAHTGDQKLAQMMYLPLAEKMTLKYVNENRIEAEAEVQLYLIILDLTGKHEKALEVIHGPLGGKLISEVNVVAVKTAELYCKLERWSEMNLAYKTLLKQEPDQWTFYLEYFKSVFTLIETNWSKPCIDADTDDTDQSKQAKDISNEQTKGKQNLINYDDVDSTIQQCENFLREQLCAQNEQNHKYRGPYLAKMQLQQQVLEKNMQSTVSLYELLFEYYEVFGDKPCCFNDIKPYVELLSAQEKLQFVSTIKDKLCLGTDEEPVMPDSLRLMQRHLLYVQLCRCTGAHHALSDASKLTLVKCLIKRYQHGLSYGADLLTTDIQPCDNYILLAVFNLFDMYTECNKTPVLWQCILLLVYALKQSPSNFCMKILLLRMYSMLGAFGPCVPLYESLDVKHAQHDAIGYIVSNHSGRLGHYYSSGSVYSTMLKFFTGNHKDTGDLISSYKYGCFSRINEVVKFRERLHNSLQCATATTERMLLDLTLESKNHDMSEYAISFMEIDAAVDLINYEALCDNRDFNVISTWNPADKDFSAADQQRSFDEEKTWLRYRNTLLRCIAGGLYLGIPIVHNVETLPKGKPDSKPEPAGKKGKTRNRSKSVNGPENNEKDIEVNNEVQVDDSSNISNGAVTRSQGDIMQSLAGEYLAMVTDCQNCSKNQYPLNGPYCTRLQQCVSCSDPPVLIEMMHILIYIHGLHENGLDTASETFEEKMDTVFAKKLKDCVLTCKRAIVTKESDFVSTINADVLESIVNTTETISFVTLFAGSCHRLLSPIAAEFSKPSKKKDVKINMTLPPTLQHFNNLLVGVTEAIQLMNENLTLLESEIMSVKHDQLQLDGQDNVIEQILADLEVDRIWCGVQNSFQDSCKQISALLSLKVIYLESLKL